MNIKLKSIKKALLVALASVVTTVIVASPVAAIPYQGANTPALPSPAFNQYTGVPSQGDESDFLRGRESGNGSFVNNVSSACNNGQEFSLQVYVHNGADQNGNNNGSGPSVAHGTRVRIQLPGGTTSSFNPSATISSSNAGTVSDNMTINCGGRNVNLSYVTGSAVQVNTLSGTQALSDSIVTTGAPIGTMSPNGDVWGCWDQRVFVYLKVKVEVVPVIPQSLGECRSTDVNAESNRRVTVNINNVFVDNATIVGYRTDYGDGTVINTQNSNHTYANDGTYTITSSVQIRFADGRTEWVTANGCIRNVTFRNGEPPIVTPPTPGGSSSINVTTLPNTGAGAVAGIFAGVTTLSTLAYSVISRRFS